MAEFPDALIEQAARMLEEHCTDTMDDLKIDGVWTWGYCCECGEVIEHTAYNAHVVRHVLEAVVPAIRAQALRDAARDLPICEAGNEVRTYEWLRERADQIENPATVEEPPC